MLTAILIDDEYYALEVLKKRLEELEVHVAGMYEEGHSAIEAIGILKPDIVFLDIDMPGMNGLELFDQLMEIYPKTHIVFATAYNEYAVEAFELNAADYIVKPIRKERLKKTIERFQRQNNPPALRKSVEINCFRHLSIKIEGKIIEIPWRTKKVEELVAYLACGEGSFISKEKLAEILWPELDMEKSRSNFYLTYHYLKKQSNQLGFEFPMESIRGKIRLKIEEIELDIMNFKREITELKNITTENIDRAEKTIEQYKGLLLEEHYYEWSIELVQYYDIRYRELLKKVIKYHKFQKDTEKEKYFITKLNA